MINILILELILMILCFVAGRISHTRFKHEYWVIHEIKDSGDTRE